MGFLDQFYEAAANAGFLKQCTWRPSSGAPAQSQLVGFGAADGTAFDGLTASTEYVMSYPDTGFRVLSVRENVEIDGVTFQVREIRAIGDGSEMRAKLTRL
ncbi:hypothetical protein JI739_19730 [Ramlibacter sp. AW1]|uniref:Uncharacterized protein n=1 Tax=Ramlibacter aurantiacus TaxID=2801330 RepID=A0A937D5D1_9BURK|nr:hypothetical protein [Ramlibacter aurantiacus]MBL0422585.1 hypothetical protein [Ramlibacter aurantiacus]